FTLSPNGEILALATNPTSDSTAPSGPAHPPLVELRSWPALESLKKLEFKSPVRLLLFSADSARLLTSTADRQVQVWDTATWTEWARVTPTSLPLAAAITPDGQIAVLTREGLSLSRPKPLRDELCDRVERNLTPDEWARYMPEEKPNRTCSNRP